MKRLVDSNTADARKKKRNAPTNQKLFRSMEKLQEMERWVPMTENNSLAGQFASLYNDIIKVYRNVQKVFLSWVECLPQPIQERIVRFLPLPDVIALSCAE